MKTENHNNTFLGRRTMRSKPKIMLHEHLDCSLRPRTMLELWEEIGFEKAKIAFPADVLKLWQRANQERGQARRVLRSDAVNKYRAFLVGFASQSLANYVQAIVDHVLPLMQTRKNLTRITRERIEDAAADGIIGMELRFAPQLHTWQGLSLDDVMDAVLDGAKASPFPLKLIVCALRHENGDMARKLADLSLKYRRHVGVFDLAADEEANPGVLDWWLPEAERVRSVSGGKILLTIHLTETRRATARDKQLVREHNIGRIGHGIQDDWSEVRECCPTSNVVTGQVRTYADHPIDGFHRQGDKVTVSTDGTLFTEVQLTDEYLKLQETFGWTEADFLKVNLTAVEASSFSKTQKARMRAQLKRAYNGKK